MSASAEPWQINTERIARSVLTAATHSKTEEDLKMAVEPIIQKALKQMGLDVSGVRYEKTSTTYGGRRDSVYGYLTIEYKKPGRLKTGSEIHKACNQLQRYLNDDARKFGGFREDYLEKAVGVATDGRRIVFVRFSKTAAMLRLPIPEEQRVVELFPEIKVRRGFQVLGPYPVSAHSIANLLVLFRASERQPLTAQNLAAVFAPPHEIACQTVAELYAAVMRAQRQQAPSRVKTFFREWDRIFGVIYGQELNKAEMAAARTAELYDLPGGVRLKQLLFAVHTFCALLMKLIAIELLALQRGSAIESFVTGLGALGDKELRNRLTVMESGAGFVEAGIVNFLEADFFSWYLDAWNPAMARALRRIVHELEEFEPATPVLEPRWTQDLLQNLYEDIVPKELRHALGEYYTPNWLAGYLVDLAGYKGKSGTRFLDPACGSGTFLVQAIDRAVNAAGGRSKVNMKVLGEEILANIVGFDLNPLAVLAARTNYLIAFARFIHDVRPISLPVYLCDSVRAPSRYEEEGELEFRDRLVFTTSKGDYVFPIAMKEQEQIDKFTGMIDVGLRSKLEVKAFRQRVTKEFGFNQKDTEMLVSVYQQVKKLDDDHEDGIWARYIKNAFAPVYVGKFDYVVGNPPWIRWGYLSDDYRKKTLRMWHRYGLFSLKGHETRLGAGEKDFSMLFTYVCADNYLKDKGKLGFLITMEVFKSKGAGEGFRGFELKHKRIPLKVLRMEDMVDLKPFRAANKTSLFVLQKGKRTRYPVTVLEWKRKPGVGHVRPNWEFPEVRRNTVRSALHAKPVNLAKPTSSWQTATEKTLAVLKKLKGISSYKAWVGARIEPYGVFWLCLKEVRPDGLLVVENMHDRGKTAVNPAHVAVEPDLVYPTVSGGELIRFGTKDFFHTVVAQDPKTRRGFDSDVMSAQFPLTYAYLKSFEDILLRRAAYKKYYCDKVLENDGAIKYVPKAPFYSQYNIGPWTFSQHRVTWKRMASRMTAAVLSSVRTLYGRKRLISTDTTSLIEAGSRDEAHYLCALLNSDVVDSYIRSFSSAGRGFGAPSVMANVAIPKFDPKNRLHGNLAELSKDAHTLVRTGKPIDDIQSQINKAARELWNIKS